MSSIKSLWIQLILLLSGAFVSGQEISIQKEFSIPYYSYFTNSQELDSNKLCQLDIYYPKGLINFPTVVWFHGGGLVAGDKRKQPPPLNLLDKGICVISVNYRLYPKVKCPVYLEDAAAAVAWVFKNIDKYGGNRNLIFVSGHSAGAYITSMIGLDKSWLKEYDIDANKIAGLFPLSGNGITHQAIRDEIGISKMTPYLDEFAPLFHVRADASPLILITGDRELEYIGRYEENAYFERMMKLSGHKRTYLYEMEGYDHGMVYPALPIMLKHIKSISSKILNNEQ